jgi:hypothetical protein
MPDVDVRSFERPIDALLNFCRALSMEASAPMSSALNASPEERRRHHRTPIGIPVRVYLDETPALATVEMVDVSASGCALRAPEHPPYLGQRAAFGFVVADRGFCLARGRVVRLSQAGFAVAFDDTNPAFDGFVGDVSVCGRAP